MRVASLAVTVVLVAGIASFPNAGMAASSSPALPALPQSSAPALSGSASEQQLASVGCIVAGTATAALVGTVGAMSLSATGGAAAVITPETLALMGAAFTAGCGVGMMVAPGAVWLLERAGFMTNGGNEQGTVIHQRDDRPGVDLAARSF